MDPGLTDVFAKYAAKHLFDEVHGVHVRDGGDMYIEGYAFAPVFSIWTTIEECLNPPLLYEKDHGWYTTEPFSGAERFVFPEGVGPVECVNVEHEEVVLAPRGLDIRSASFKYALGDEFIDVLRTLHKLGLDSTKKIKVGSVEVAPGMSSWPVTPDLDDGRRPDDRPSDRRHVGYRTKDGRPREVYLTRWRTARRSGGTTASRSSAGRPVSTRSSRWSSSPRARGVPGIAILEEMDPDPYMDLMDTRDPSRDDGDRAGEARR
jgi:saccharopine dehydrogenase-like NADP-dependent oxidoreductase